MSFDGLMLAAVVTELAAALTGGRVNKVYQPADHEIVLHMYAHAANHKLIISAHPQHARLHLTNISFENPPSPPTFCMLLRKHLEGARLLRIEQPGWERVARLHFTGTDELGLPSERVLIAEPMGRSANIVLVDGSGRVLDALRRTAAGTVRPIWPGQPYTPPPPQAKVDPTNPELVAVLADAFAVAGSTELDRVLQQHVAGFSPGNAREAIHRAGLAAPLTDAVAAAELAAAAAESLARLAQDRAEPHWHKRPDGRVAFAPFSLGYTGVAGERFATPSQLLDHVFGSRVATERFEQQRAALGRQVRDQLTRHQRKLQRQEDALAEAASADQLRLYGELLTASLHAVPAGASSVQLPNWYDAAHADVNIELDPRLSAAANAQLYFKRFRKAQATLAGAGEQAAKTRNELAYLEQVEHLVEQAATADDLAQLRAELAAEGFLRLRPLRGQARARLAGERPRMGRTARAGRGDTQRKGEPPLPPFRFQSSDGHTILVGRNNRQNDWLTLRHAAQHDMWLHAKDMPGSHVILVVPPGTAEVPETSMMEAAAIAAYYSKGREAGRVPVDFTERRNVHKPRGAKPGMVIYDHHRTLYVQPDPGIVERLRRED